MAASMAFLQQRHVWARGWQEMPYLAGRKRDVELPCRLAVQVIDHMVHLHAQNLI